jgi:DNA-binding winged helix-turn-helix (wHTH) protein
MNVVGKRVYWLGQIELDASQGCIKINGREQYLRQKAFQLLLYLLEHRDRLVTKEELIENIWEGTAVTDDALVQLVKEVRRSLGDDPRQPQFIKTVPKVGYRFIGPVDESITGASAIEETKEITTVEVEYEEESNGHTQLVEIAARRLFSPARKLGKRRLIPILASSAIVIAVITLAIYFRPVKRHCLK